MDRCFDISDIHEKIHLFMLHISISTLLCLHNDCPAAHPGSGPGLSMLENYANFVTYREKNKPKVFSKKCLIKPKEVVSYKELFNRVWSS